ncbi:MAG TPA: SDR family oxidoreductase [Burkholderiaceae bacterium]|nr:SDR family oxidoreductase [Burkholderiaceae bacterium]HQR70788.1 SDR family oxidoreductase [Burkholderiaceae bacterium]
MTDVFSGKVAVVTGAASGIGRGLATELAARGARLALSDVSATGLAETAAMCRSEVRTYRVDVAQRQAVFEHADAVLRDFGAVDYLFNNAGVALKATFEHATLEEIDWQLSINLYGVIYCAKAFLPSMLARRSGCIVNISSTAGLIGFPGIAAYCISKFGVRGLTETLSRELEGTGVTAVSVHPGGVRTQIAASARKTASAGAIEVETGRSLEKMLVTPPEVCAAEILAGVARGRRRIFPAKYATTFRLISYLPPRWQDAVLRALS